MNDICENLEHWHIEAFTKEYGPLISILDYLRDVLRCPKWTEPTLPG